MVGETDIDLQAPFFEGVFNPVDNFSAQAWISATEIESRTDGRARVRFLIFEILVSHR